MIEVIFWLIIFIIFYTYAGYSLFILLLSLFINRPIKKKEVYPRVTFLITAYNEEHSIAAKLKNTLHLDYPVEKLEVVVASDGSTDSTDTVVKQFHDQGVILKRVEGRVGKTETQNQTVAKATGDIIIFSDATTSYKEDAIRKIVRNYADPQVGAVSGRYEYINPTGAAVGLGTVLFWKYENLIKRLQTRIQTITGCCGCIYSVRRDLYEPLPRDIISDLVEPLKILEKGFRISFEPEAVAYEETTETSKEEFGMRVRVISRGMNGLWYMRSLFNPFKYGFISFQLFSHKVLRWMIPFMLPLLLVSNFLLIGELFYNLCFIVQVLFYLGAGAGYLLDRSGKKAKLLALPLYYCVVNAASITAFFRTLTGRKSIVWETVR
ncbi:MAG: glycosyltransferase family 2 protein [Thermodesulfobacteriota bacterium]|jgi:cellulose synthase/poly-beta-1,6-N-acetylglucosamine synthase-like glycosyltransferase